MTQQPPRPLEGLLVLDMATLLAGPVATTILAEFGANVIKIEMPGRGDSNREGPGPGAGLSYTWLQEGRNKRSITLDLHKEEGQELLKLMVTKADVVASNFRPGVLEGWGLGPEVLLEINPRLVLLLVSGYGQTGPYREKGAFDRNATAFAGGTFVTGFEDSPPVRAGFATADYMAAYVGAYAVTLALYWRDAKGGGGQVIDLGLYEPVLRASEAAIPAYDRTGHVRGRSGNRNPGVVPAGNFLAADGIWVVLNASTVQLWQRMARAMGREDLLIDQRFATPDLRRQNQEELYRIIEDWAASKQADEVSDLLNAAKVPAAPINSIAEIFNDPHIADRKNIVRVEDRRIGSLAVPGVIPKLSHTPGRIEHLGRDLGQDNEDIYGSLLGLSKAELDELRTKGVI